MEEMLNHSGNAEDLNNQASGFHRLSKNEKLELLEKIIKPGNADAGAFLNLIYPGETDKDIQKYIRMLFHKLKTAGIKTEEPKISGEPVLRKVEDRKEYKGFMSSYDDSNTRVVLSAFEVKKNSFIFLSGTVHFTDGLVELLTAPVDRKGFEEIIREYQLGAGEGMVFVDISSRYAVYILEEESAKSGKYKEDILQVKRFASNIQDSIQKPEDIYGLECPEAAHSLTIEKILAHAIFEPFKLTWSSIEEDKKEYSSIGSSAIVLPAYMVEEKKQAFLKTLIERDELKLQTAPVKRMLEDYAYIFYSLKELPYYRGLTDCLRDPGATLNAVLHFLGKSLDTEEKKEEGVIVNPYG